MVWVTTCVDAGNMQSPVDGDDESCASQVLDHGEESAEVTFKGGLSHRSEHRYRIGGLTSTATRRLSLSLPACLPACLPA